MTRGVAVLAIAGGTLTFGVVGTPVSAQIGKPPPVVITLKNLAFKPNRVEVLAGTRVDFTWKEKVAHNVVFSKTDKSKNLSGGVYSRTFLEKGIFKFKCTIHPGMKGQITVK